MNSDDCLIIGSILLFIIASLAYSVVVTHTLLLWAVLVFSPILVYFVWQFVRAFERIADALEEQIEAGK
jgi:membrane protein implicated in regulation of membrane protease activity